MRENMVEIATAIVIFAILALFVLCHSTMKISFYVKTRHVIAMFGLMFLLIWLLAKF